MLDFVNSLYTIVSSDDLEFQMTVWSLDHGVANVSGVLLTVAHTLLWKHMCCVWILSCVSSVFSTPSDMFLSSWIYILCPSDNLVQQRFPGVTHTPWIPWKCITVNYINATPNMCNLWTNTMCSFRVCDHMLAQSKLF